MQHRSILIRSCDLSFPTKTCFENFSQQIPYGSRIAIIGRNGSGKSSLLSMLHGTLAPSNGQILLPHDAHIGFVPQILQDHHDLSGGQRFQVALTEALSASPNCLLLDEPTNHLDLKNQKSLLRMLQSYSGTLIVVSHDRSLLRSQIDTFWHIENQSIKVFHGHFDDYQRQRSIERLALEKELDTLNRQRKALHDSLMQEQQRASKSQAQGKKKIAQRKWPTITSPTKFARSSETSGAKCAEIDKKKDQVQDRLQACSLSPIILPTFTLSPHPLQDRTLVTLDRCTLAYDPSDPILSHVSFSIRSQDRIALQGDNASGKTTLLKAILRNPSVLLLSGSLTTIAKSDIGYLDQHYQTLSPKLSALDNLQLQAPKWTTTQLRLHLSDFLFRTNEEVHAIASSLSGGEKARLSLALIAANPPKLLILDELTNNLDIETKDHVTQILAHYPGAILAISHEQAFLKAIGIQDFHTVHKGLLERNVGEV